MARLRYEDDRLRFELAFKSIEPRVLQVLRKGSKGPQIDDAETFTVDWKFKDK